MKKAHPEKEQSLLSRSVGASGKKKIRRDKNAPHKPVNAYVLYLTRNREAMRLANPGKSFPDVTILLAEEWMKMTNEQKQPYIQESQEKKQKYLQEMETYKLSDSFKIYQERVQKIKQELDNPQPIPSASESKPTPTPKKVKKGPEKSEDKKPLKTEKKEYKKKTPMKTSGGDAPTTSKQKKVSTPSAFRRFSAENASELYEGRSNTQDSWRAAASTLNIPIFTQEFLDYNKTQETELRKLRKMTNDYEEQNAVLSKHIENMKAAEIKLQAEMSQMREKNESVEQYLSRLKEQFVTSFSKVAIPGSNEYPTLETVDSYIEKLHKKVTETENKENDLISEKLQAFVQKFVDTPDDQ